MSTIGLLACAFINAGHHIRGVYTEKMKSVLIKTGIQERVQRVRHITGRPTAV